MDSSEYEQVFTPTNFSAEWRRMFKPTIRQRSSVYSIPLSEVTSEQEDCPFEHDIEEPQQGTNVEMRYEDQCGLSEESGLARHASLEREEYVKTRQELIPNIPRELLDTFATLKSLDVRMQMMEEQCRKQDLWNETTQKDMEALAKSFNKVGELESTVAALEGQVKAIRGRKSAVSVRHNAK
ncbi:hypothetical protein N7478_000789 [Penicillium angulare]|uniref:uncharacterized protein n=1 Tax=Penicillium angulare TaxID=116970 RepID=UPI0025425311|nr:uncharacterized protein N7478_000789 [Penicillium angulare]KAJ5291538.1 hypothetical protein N7478_000789 [Penicillium angulare]